MKSITIRSGDAGFPDWLINLIQDPCHDDVEDLVGYFSEHYGLVYRAERLTGEAFLDIRDEEKLILLMLKYS